MNIDKNTEIQASEKKWLHLKETKCIEKEEQHTTELSYEYHIQSANNVNWLCYNQKNNRSILGR